MFDLGTIKFIVTNLTKPAINHILLVVELLSYTLCHGIEIESTSKLSYPPKRGCCNISKRKTDLKNHVFSTSLTNHRNLNNYCFQVLSQVNIQCIQYRTASL